MDKVFFKTLVFLAVPIILQEILNSSVNMMDTFMIGQLGDIEVAAVGLANQIFFLFSLMLFGINSGASVFMGQYWGKGEIESIHKIMGISFVLSFSAAFLFCFGALCIPETLMNIYSKDELVVQQGVKYLRVIALSYFMSAFIITINTALKSIGQTKFPMFTTFISLISNIILNYIFIFILEMGVSGAALGTIISRTIEVLVQILLINKFKVPIAVNIKNYFNADKEFTKKFLKLTYPVILNECMWALGTSIYNIAYKYSGTQAQAAVQISGTIQNLFMVVGIGIGAASGIILSNTLGAGDLKKAIRYSRNCIVMAVILSVIMGIGLFNCSGFIVSLFEVNDVVKLYAQRILFVVAVGMIFKTFNYTTVVGILRSGGDTRFCLILDASSVWFIGIPMAFLGSKFLQLPIYWTFALVYLEEFFKFFLSGKRVLSNKWANTIVG